MVQTSDYCYSTAGQANGYTHGLHYVFTPQSYARLTAGLGTNLGSLTDAQVAPYADNAFQYDSSQRVTQEVVAGTGDSQTGGGLGTYGFSYTASTNTPGFNSWAMKTVVTNPDGSTDTVYTNFIAEVMLDDHYGPASVLHTDQFHEYNTNAQLILDAARSPVTAAEFSRIGAGPPPRGCLRGYGNELSQGIGTQDCRERKVVSLWAVPAEMQDVEWKRMSARLRELNGGPGHQSGQLDRCASGTLRGQCLPVRQPRATQPLRKSAGFGNAGCGKHCHACL